MIIKEYYKQGNELDNQKEQKKFLETCCPPRVNQKVVWKMNEEPET